MPTRTAAVSRRPRHWPSGSGQPDARPWHVCRNAPATTPTTFCGGGAMGFRNTGDEAFEDVKSNGADDASAKADAGARRKRPAETLSQRGVRIISASEFVKSFEPPELVIPALTLRKRAVYSMTGRTSHGKTGIVMHLSLCKAQGLKFGKEPVPLGRVLILAGENPEDHLMRLVLAQHKYGLSDEVLERIHVLRHAFPMLHHADEVVAMAADFGLFDLVFVETSAAYFHGDDDNHNIQMREHAVACRSLIRIPGNPCVVVAAHPKISADSAEAMVPRGGGAFLNEVDGNMSVFSTEKGVTTTLHWTGKWRGPTIEPITFR